MPGKDIGFFTLPVIVSFQNIDKIVNDELGRKLEPAAKKMGEDFAKELGEGVKKDKSLPKQLDDTLGKQGGETAKKAGRKVGTEYTKATADEVKRDKSVEKATTDTLEKAGTEVARKAGKKTGETYTKSLGDQLKDSANTVAQDFSGGLLDGMQDSISRSRFGDTIAEDLIGGVLDGAQDAIRGADFVGLGGDVVDSLRDGIDGGDLKDAADGLMDGVKGAVQGGFDDLKGAGKQWVDGIVSGLKSGDIDGTLKTYVTDPLRTASTEGSKLFGKMFDVDTTEFDKDVQHILTSWDTAATRIEKIPLVPEIAGAAAGAAIQTALEKGLASGLTAAGLVKAGVTWTLPITVAAYLTWFEIEHPYVSEEDKKKAALGRYPELRPEGPIRRRGINEEPHPYQPGGPLGQQFIGPGFRAYGGAIAGPGGPMSDVIPLWASSGEHVLSAKDVAALGGQSGVYDFRKALHMAGGGAVNAEIQSVSGIASQHGLSLTSGFRDPGGPTISGVPAARSYHGSGAAGDFSNGFQTDEMLAFARYMATNYGSHLSELIYSDPRMPQLIHNGSVVDASFYGASTLRGHRDHVHVAIKAGAAPELVAGRKPLPGAAADEAAAASILGGAHGTLGGAAPGPGGAAAAKPAADITKQFQQQAKADLNQFVNANISNAVVGVKETLGLGEVFPDFTETPLFQSVMGGAMAFMPLLEGAMKGKLGIQEPGWKPGMPVKALSEGGGGGTGWTIGGLGGLGVSDIAVPEAPGPPEAAGGPGGGPTVINNVSADINYNQSTVGVDPVAQRQQDERRQNTGIARSGIAPVDPGRH